MTVGGPDEENSGSFTDDHFDPELVGWKAKDSSKTRKRGRTMGFIFGDRKGLVTVETGQKITFNPPYEIATDQCDEEQN